MIALDAQSYFVLMKTESLYTYQLFEAFIILD
jgi:hypothetical protein